MSSGRGDAILAGPRGRRLCWAAVDAQSFSRTGYFQLSMGFGGEKVDFLELVRHEVSLCDLDLLSRLEEVALLGLVKESVDVARYWQDPDEVDLALADAELSAAFLPVAEALASASGAAWWWSDLAPEEQVWTDWREDNTPPPVFLRARSILEGWRDQSKKDEVRLRGRDASGVWWSSPIWWRVLSEVERRSTEPGRLATTTRRLSRLGSAELLMREERTGQSEARCWPIRVIGSPRLFEIHGAEDWLELVRRFPLDVTYGRRGNWELATGVARRWVIPDWLGVSDIYDAVHLSVAGYLAISGRLLEPGDGAGTLVAGWSPDETYWLADDVEVVGDPTDWVAIDSSGCTSWQAAR